MSDQLFMEERRREILKQLRQLGRVSVKDLSDLLNVSTVTIRQDLQALEQENRLKRTHGGAVPTTPQANSPELSFDVRLGESSTEKQRLAQAAAQKVQGGDSIALDAGTTTFAMLPYLKKLDRLLIVTHSLMVAQHLLDAPHIRVLMPGGRLRRDSISLVGNSDQLPDINLNFGFFGAHGISQETGITETGPEEVAMKVAMISRCMASYFVVDQHKWGKIGPYSVITPDKITGIITSSFAPGAMVKDMCQQGANIEIVRIPEN